MARDRFWRGESVRIDVAFTDAAGQPMPASGVTIRAKRPDGTIVEGSVLALPETGAFYAIFELAQSGAWAVRAACTGPTASAVEDRFDVAPSYVL